MRPDTSTVDFTWKGLYRIGGISLIIVGILYFCGAIFSYIIGPAPSSGVEYMQGIMNQILISGINFVFFIIAHFFLIAGVLALYFALKGINKKAMILSIGIMSVFIVLDIAVTEVNSLALVSLSQGYTLATTEAQRAAYLAAAYYALATIPIGTFISYVVSSVGLLIMSVVMLKGVFRKIAPLLGIAASIEGIIGGFYIFIPSLVILLSPCLITFTLWCIASGTRLNILAKK